MSKPQKSSSGKKQPLTPKYFQVLSPYNYTNRDGEEKTGWTEVGIGFPSKDGEGVNIELRPGISVSGRIVVRPGRSKGEDKHEGDVPQRFQHDLNTPVGELV